MTKFGLLLGLCVAMSPTAAFAAPLPDIDLDPAERVILLCDAPHERLQVRAIGDHDDADATYPERKVIEVAGLIGMARGRYRVFKSRSYSCGRYAVKFSGDALNANIQGELGAEPAFLSVDIGNGGTNVLTPTRLVICESGDASPRRGKCPTDYAIRLTIAHEGATSVVGVTAMEIADEPDAEQVTTKTCQSVPDSPREMTRLSIECGT